MQETWDHKYQKVSKNLPTSLSKKERGNDYSLADKDFCPLTMVDGVKSI